MVMPCNPGPDDHIIAEYSLMSNEKVETITFSTMWVDSLENFGVELSRGPDSEGCWASTECLDGSNCGPIWCDPCVTTHCCYPCRVYCGITLCDP